MQTSGKNAKEIGGYVLKWENLIPGDIVLSRHTFGLGIEKISDVVTSKIIRTGSQGEYSHAMLYLGQTIVHAQKPGVFSLNPQRLYVSAPDDLCVLRHLHLTEEAKCKIANYARSQVGTLYSTSEAITTVILHKTNVCSLTRQQFCSRLVAQSYLVAGIQLVSNVDYCAPGDFLRSEALYLVPDITRLASREDLEVINSRDFVIEDQRHTFAWLNVARAIAAKDGIEIRSVTDAVSFAIKYPNADEAIAAAIKDSGYLNTWREDDEAHPYRHEEIELIALAQSKHDVFAREVNAIIPSARRFSLELLFMRELSKLCKSETLALHIELYNSLVRNLGDRAVVVARVLMMIKRRFYEMSRVGLLCGEIASGESSHTIDETDKTFDELQSSFDAFS